LFKNLKRKYLNLLWVIFITSCIPPVQEAPPDPRSFSPPDTDLLELGYALQYFKDFMYAMEKTNLVYIMEDEGPYTVFAPVQQSFSLFRKLNNIDNLDQFPEEKLSQILQYHILPGNLILSNIPAGYNATLLLEKTTGNPVDLFIENHDIFMINGLNVIDEEDLQTTNGYIHSIIKVLEVPSMLDQLTVNPAFSLFTEILKRPDLDPELKALLSDKNPDTFFAPTNKALKAFIESNPAWDSLADIPLSLLNTLIRNHLISQENIVLNGIFGTVSLKLMNNEEITVKTDYPRWSIIYQDEKKANIDIRDIQGIDGIIHQIDRVLSF
jgi:uncharacterized surface protein with fasciclin (FAS1) repeats